jgi:hypothetical protein
MGILESKKALNKKVKEPQLHQLSKRCALKTRLAM